MSDSDEIRRALEERRGSGQKKVVYDKATGQFRVLQSFESVNPDRQTEMTPSNIPNALRAESGSC